MCPTTCLNFFSCMPHRDLFYRDVQLFGKQTVVDRVRITTLLFTILYGLSIGKQLVDDLAATWQLERSDLNVVRDSGSDSSSAQ
jgi:DNA topoisomerase VI subunit A